MGILSKLLLLISNLFVSKNKAIAPKSKIITRKKRVKKGIIICLDPGHGGSDPGAIYPKDDPDFIEAILALEICEFLTYALDDAGYSVVITRADNDSPISRIDRINRIKKSKSDLLVSVHCNSFHKDAYGIETLYNSSNPKSQKLAKSIQQELKLTYPDHKDRGIKVRNNLYVLKTMSPSALVEVEFINTAGAFIEDNVEQIAQTIFEGIESFLS